MFFTNIHYLLHFLIHERAPLRFFSRASFLVRRLDIFLITFRVLYLRRSWKKKRLRSKFKYMQLITQDVSLRKKVNDVLWTLDSQAPCDNRHPP